MHGLVDVAAGAERRDHDRNTVMYAGVQIVLEPIVRLVHDEIDGERRRAGLIRNDVRDLREPFIQQLLRSRIQRRE